MEPAKNELVIVKSRFPAKWEAIERLYRENEEFRALCEDYYLCVKSMERFQMEFSEKMDSIEEFRDLSKSLENELNDFLDRKTG